MTTISHALSRTQATVAEVDAGAHIVPVLPQAERALHLSDELGASVPLDPAAARLPPTATGRALDEAKSSLRSGLSETGLAAEAQQYVGDLLEGGNYHDALQYLDAFGHAGMMKDLEVKIGAYLADPSNIEPGGVTFNAGNIWAGGRQQSANVKFNNGLRAIFKPEDLESTEATSDIHYDAARAARHEVLSYQVDRAAGFHQVALTVRGKIPSGSGGHATGSMQLWAKDDSPSLRGRDPSAKPYIPSSIWKVLMLDYFIRQTDRQLVLGGRNYATRPFGGLAYDNSFAFAPPGGADVEEGSLAFPSLNAVGLGHVFLARQAELLDAPPSEAPLGMADAPNLHVRERAARAQEAQYQRIINTPESELRAALEGLEPAFVEDAMLRWKETKVTYDAMRTRIAQLVDEVRANPTPQAVAELKALPWSVDLAMTLRNHLSRTSREENKASRAGAPR